MILYRWLSLIPALVSLAIGGDSAPLIAIGVLLAAVLVNLLITLLPTQLNAMLRRRPWLLALDVLFCAALAGLTDGWNSSYYLYAFSPLLAAAFFFEMRGALLTAAGMAGLFLVVGHWGAAPDRDWLRLVAQLVGFFLIAGTFGYATHLLARLRMSHAELNRMHRDLAVIHSLTLSLQSASDINEVEERVLTAVTGDLGFPCAVMALVDQNERVITAWVGKARDGRPLFAGGLPHPARVPLTADEGPIAQCLLDGQMRLSVAQVRTSNERVNAYLGQTAYHIFPLLLREHPVGVLLVDASEQADPARLYSLQAIVNQAAVAVGTTMLCIDRAQRLAVQDERIRIARELHDTVSQSLFGIVYALEGLGKLLPDRPETVKLELEQVKALAETTRVQMRQSIMDMWPSALTAETFEADLRRFVTEICHADDLQVDIQVRGPFARLSPLRRRSLYRVAQEALTNVVKHAQARHVEVLLDIGDDQAGLTVRDDGRGFDPAIVNGRVHDRERFGLRSIRERVASLGGTCEVISAPGAGATVRTSLPLTDGG
ncbi:MAG: GAF domain-containing sensor histidine kinase [Anaerolineales bacterium]|nr:GAF domain-containing sensor histidine kinase [Anaerolineales bacterium]